ncbi:MAG: AAA family ATPase [Candidatus Binatus sp.]|uniref:McrB family protein n=1 Tax=Candidatus Binatus sp. TaxID=2811406 RepID=UPI0027285B83|nr:AAA family ATPase [Candidatus Binatus sp.]MDO8431750.1 AAA family ATPase [Candidatus Binatus sp.]
MWADKLVSAILERGYSNAWPEKFKAGFEAIFGGDGGRYPDSAKRHVTLRGPAPSEDKEGIVPFAALIHPSNPSTGPYGGTSLAVFPGDDAPCLISLVVGTSGLAPDEEILGRPGHARKAAAVCAWLNSGQRKLVAWSKHDPTRLDQRIPSEVADEFGNYSRAIGKYGHVLYAIYEPGSDKNQTLGALTAFLDLMFAERGIGPLTRFEADAHEIRTRWFHYLMPQVSNDAVAELLNERHYVILQGPPGTGKTHMARKLISTEYHDRGRTIQFHANTTYENFVGGLAPRTSSDSLGFQFAPHKGFLTQAAEQARASSGKYLLHIDEINRADLSKVLGEAIYLLEPDDLERRLIDLPYEFEPPTGNRLSLPDNLHILGTMNTSDRSLAIVDIAIRRRFAFTKLWPQISVVESEGCDLMKEAFQRLLSIFVDHATEDAMNLVPGHSYFLESNVQKARKRLETTLKPLLEDYLEQGYVSSFAEAVRSYLQWIDSQ